MRKKRYINKNSEQFRDGLQKN